VSDNIFLVQTNAVAGQDAEFNDWYDNRHLSDLLALPGFTSAQRFRISTVQRYPSLPPYPYRYLAMYEVDGKPERALTALNEAVQNGLYVSPAMDPERSFYVFTPLGPKVARTD
jgi:hypothetical protein